MLPKFGLATKGEFNQLICAALLATVLLLNQAGSGKNITANIFPQKI